MPELVKPTAADWGLLVRFARRENSNSLTASSLARLLAYGVVEYKEEPPKRPELAPEAIVESNRKLIVEVRESVRKICPKNPNIQPLRDLLYKFKIPAKAPAVCKKLVVSAKGWAELKKWGVEKSSGACAA